MYSIIADFINDYNMGIIDFKELKFKVIKEVFKDENEIERNVLFASVLNVMPTVDFINTFERKEGGNVDSFIICRTNIN